MTDYTDEYSAELLQPIKRLEQREKIGLIRSEYNFKGADIWRAYEFTWLNKRGKPEVGVLRFEIQAASPFFIESKSFKLYLGSFAGSIFSGKELVLEALQKDLSTNVGSQVLVDFLSPEDLFPHDIHDPNLVDLDKLDIDISEYEYNPELLQGTGKKNVSEVISTNLFRSLCPMTAQPDFASIIVEYRGAGIKHESLLSYLISFRRHAAFSEQIVERVYCDLMKNFSFSALCVSARYTRRGGLDINPHRLFNMQAPRHIRDPRQ